LNIAGSGRAREMPSSIANTQICLTGVTKFTALDLILYR
jgi:hypothetical protein